MDLCFVFIKDLDVHLTLLGFAFLNKKLSIYIGKPYIMFTVECPQFPVPSVCPHLSQDRQLPSS